MGPGRSLPGPSSSLMRASVSVPSRPLPPSASATHLPPTAYKGLGFQASCLGSLPPQDFKQRQGFGGRDMHSTEERHGCRVGSTGSVHS